MKIHRIPLLFSFILFFIPASFTQVAFHRVDPPNWWVGMADSGLRLMVYGNDLAGVAVNVHYPGVRLEKVTVLENPDYMILDLHIEAGAPAGFMPFVFEHQREILFEIEYELKQREEGSRDRIGFGAEDVIYLAMPDRFSNGETANDNVQGMLEPADRSNPDGRHGGDIQGIAGQLDYLAGLGITALWLNPVQENNMPAYSYHGYAITDHYRVDPRFGDNDSYKGLVERCHEKGIKVIMDMVFNHCGGNHFWMKELPVSDWVHQFPEYTRSNFRAETVMDPYASDYDRDRMLKGWFDKPMPDLNQHNEFLADYLIQNSIWWVEFAGLDGIRMDTWPYSYKDFMGRWMQRIRQEYPNLAVLGETWLQKEAHTAYWQSEAPVSGDYQSHLGSVTDFPLQYALKDAFNEAEGWTSGLARIYYVLSQDFMYSDPFKNVIFADNHDLTRLYSSLGEDFAKYKMAMTILLTTRGIPMIYYGTELLMTGEEPKGHGYIREDFPLGEWPVDTNAMQSENSVQPGTLNDQQAEALDFTRKMLNWRKHQPLIHHGKLKQFVPFDGMYVYFRYDDDNAVMVVVNKNKESRQLALARFDEVMKDYSGGRNVMNGQVMRFDDSLYVPESTALVLELIKAQ
jgi:glycosidase